MRKFFHKLLRWLVLGTCMLVFSLFIDWLILNAYTGCCEGGYCVPQWLYPQCIND